MIEWRELDWWGLPGPRRFLAAAVASAFSIEGVSELSLPDPHPAGLLAAVAMEIEQSTASRALIADASQGLGRRGPAHWLAARAAVVATGIRSAAEFLDDPGLGDVVFIVHAISREDWRVWASFLRLLRTERFRRARLSAPSVVVIPPPWVNPRELAAVFGRRGPSWLGRIGRLDTEIYAAKSFAWLYDGDVAARAAMACVVEISGWDPRMVKMLIGLELRDQLDPLGALSRAAVSLPLVHPTWENGLVDSWDGAAFEHSLSVARRGGVTVLRQRVWRAQVRVLFPFLEQARTATVLRHRRELDRAMPYTKQFLGGREKVYSEPDWLEFYDIHKLLQDGLFRSEAQFLKSCADLRRRLAHMDPAPPDLISLTAS